MHAPGWNKALTPCVQLRSPTSVVLEGGSPSPSSSPASGYQGSKELSDASGRAPHRPSMQQRGAHRASPGRHPPPPASSSNSSAEPLQGIPEGPAGQEEGTPPPVANGAAQAQPPGEPVALTAPQHRGGQQLLGAGRAERVQSPTAAWRRTSWLLRRREPVRSRPPEEAAGNPAEGPAEPKGLLVPSVRPPPVAAAAVNFWAAAASKSGDTPEQPPRASNWSAPAAGVPPPPQQGAAAKAAQQPYASAQQKASSVAAPAASPWRGGASVGAQQLQQQQRSPEGSEHGGQALAPGSRSASVASVRSARPSLAGGGGAAAGGRQQSAREAAARLRKAARGARDDAGHGEERQHPAVERGHSAHLRARRAARGERGGLLHAVRGIRGCCSECGGCRSGGQRQAGHAAGSARSAAVVACRRVQPSRDAERGLQHHPESLQQCAAAAE